MYCLRSLVGLHLVEIHVLSLHFIELFHLFCHFSLKNTFKNDLNSEMGRGILKNVFFCILHDSILQRNQLAHFRGYLYDLDTNLV